MINLTVSRVELRVRNGCICVGIDLHGITTGNASGLEDLFLPESEARYGYVSRISNGQRFLNKGPLFRGDVALLLNFHVIRTVVADVSRQTANTPIHPLINLQGITIQYGTYQRPLQTTFEKALHVKIDLSRGISCDLHLPVYEYKVVWSEEDESGNRIEKSKIVWGFGVGKVDIDLPFWVTAAVVLTGMVAAVIVPILIPLIVVGQIALLDGILPSLVDNAKRQVSNHGAELAAAAVNRRNIDTPIGQSTGFRGVTSAYLDPEGLYVAYSDNIHLYRTAEDPFMRDLARVESRLFAGSRDRYSFALRLGDVLQTLQNYCRVTWEIRRADTGAIVLRQSGPYNLFHTVTLDHLTEDLYFVDEYRVSVRLFLNRTTQQGLLFHHSAQVRVSDTLNRHKPYVTWGKRLVYFQAPDKASMWYRRAYPAIHRTATSARCLVLRGKGADGDYELEYLDRNQLNEYRDVHKRRLCPYCFTGGPSNTEAYPSQDWFRR